MIGPYKYTAETFCAALEKLAANPQALDNLRCYLEYHFAEWLEKYANTPADLAEELQNFAAIDF